MKLTKTKTLRISEQQDKTLIKMKSYKIDVCRFIRIAIKEKIERDYKYLIPKKETRDNFEKVLEKKIKKLDHKNELAFFYTKSSG